MKLRRVALPLALSAALATSPALGVVAAHAEEGIDTEAISADIEEQLESGEAVEEQVDSLGEDSTTEEIAEVSASVRSLGEATGSASSIQSLMDQIDLGPTGSTQMMFAQLQLAQAQICQQQAKEYTAKIEATQNEHKECASMIERARSLQNTAKVNNSKTAMPDDMVAYFTDRSLFSTIEDVFPKGSPTDALTADQWDYMLKALTNYQEEIGQETRTLMVYLQDFIGQYNGYLQSANAQMGGMGSASLGQTMLGGEGGTGMLVTGLLGGAAAGVVGTLLVTRAQARRTAERDAREEL